MIILIKNNINEFRTLYVCGVCGDVFRTFARNSQVVENHYLHICAQVPHTNKKRSAHHLMCGNVQSRYFRGFSKCAKVCFTRAVSTIFFLPVGEKKKNRETKKKVTLGGFPQMANASRCPLAGRSLTSVHYQK